MKDRTIPEIIANLHERGKYNKNPDNSDIDWTTEDVGVYQDNLADELEEAYDAMKIASNAVEYKGNYYYDHSRESGYETSLTNLGNRGKMIGELRNCEVRFKTLAMQNQEWKNWAENAALECQAASNSLVRNGDLYENRHDAFVAFEKLKPIPIWVPEDGILCAECVTFEEWIWLPVVKDNRYFKSQHEKFIRGEKDKDGDGKKKK